LARLEQALEDTAMADTPEHPPARHDRDLQSGPGQPPGMPRWVKVFGITVAVLLVVMLLAMLVSGGRHGPGRHLSSLGLGGVRVAPGAAVSLVLPGDVSW
jgi:hypothetical protein